MRSRAHPHGYHIIYANADVSSPQPPLPSSAGGPFSFPLLRKVAGKSCNGRDLRAIVAADGSVKYGCSHCLAMKV